MKVIYTIVIILFVFLIVGLIVQEQKKTRQREQSQRRGKQLHIVVVATDPDRADQLLASLSTKKGYIVHVKGLGEHWSGYEFKLHRTLALAKTLHPDDILMHLDAYDTFVLTDADEILKKFYKMDANVVVSTETNLAPVHEFQHIQEKMNDIYPSSPNRFRWINSGTYIGYAGAITNVLSAMPDDFHCDMPTGDKTSNSDDQRCFHTVFLKEKDKHNIKLDYNQDIFHCMWGVDKYFLEPKRIKSETGSMPCVIHGNGRAPAFNEVVNKIKSHSD